MEHVGGHEEKAANYIGAAQMLGGDENPAVLAELARAEAVLALVDAMHDLAAAVREARGPVPPGWAR
jgi:hypothetical protein